jgi:hypothetical protein
MSIMKKDLLNSLTDGHASGIEDMMRANFGSRRKTQSLSGPDTGNYYGGMGSTGYRPAKENCGCGDKERTSVPVVNPLPPPGYYDSYPPAYAQNALRNDAPHHIMTMDK